MTRVCALAAAVLLSGCASSDPVVDLTGPRPATRAELNRVLYAQTVDLAWNDGAVTVGANAVVVGRDSVRFVPNRSATARARAMGELVRIDALAVGKNRRASPFLGGVAGGLVARGLLDRSGVAGPFRIGFILGAFTAGAIVGDKIGSALSRPRPVVLYERGQLGGW